MGWDAFAISKGENVYPAEEGEFAKPFKDASDSVKALSNVDWLLEHGALDCSDCAETLEEATNSSAWDPDGWSTKKVQRLCNSAHWPKEMDWAARSAKAFLETCAEHNLSIEFSYQGDPLMTTEKAMVAVGARGVEPANLDETFRLADAIHQSRLAPYGLDSPQKVLVALLTGMGLGLPAMAALRAIHVIEGTPSVSVKAMRAVIIASGKADGPLIAEFTGEGDDYCCTVSTTRGGKLVSGTYSVKDAKTAKLWESVTSKGKPTNWILRPKRMLQARATGNLGNDHFGDVLHGIAFDEEVRDIAAMADAAPVPPSEDPLLIEALAADEPESYDVTESRQRLAEALVPDFSLDEEEEPPAPAAKPEVDDEPPIEETVRQEWVDAVIDKLNGLTILDDEWAVIVKRHPIVKDPVDGTIIELKLLYGVLEAL